MTGAWPLVRLALRRDRTMVTTTLLVLFAMTWASVRATLGLYPDAAARRQAALAAEAMPAVVAMYGHIHQLDNPGGVGLTKLAMINAFILVALVTAVVRRHTRQDEETGRLELLAAQPVARTAPLLAAVAVAVGCSLVAGVLAGVGGVLGGFAPLGCVALGAALAGLGIAWTAAVAVCAQLSASTRTVGSLAWGLFALAFVLRSVGDLRAGHALGRLVWLSPLGWMQQVRPLDGERWWVLVLPVLLFACGLALALALLGRRDLGSGLLPQRRGPAQGRVTTTAALAWRLHRGPLLGWSVGMVLLGALMGWMLDQVGTLMTPEAEQMLRQMGGAGELADLYLSVLAVFTGLLVACHGIASALQLRHEETSGHLEQLLATPATRTGVFSASAVVALLGSAWLLAVEGLATAVSHAAQTGTAANLWHDALPSLVQVPAVLVVVAVALLLAGVLPRRSTLAWAVLALCVALGEFATLLRLPSWVARLSPFAHLPQVPAEPLRWAPLLGLTAVAAALLVVAAVGWRRRDLPVG